MIYEENSNLFLSYRVQSLHNNPVSASKNLDHFPLLSFVLPCKDLHLKTQI